MGVVSNIDGAGTTVWGITQGWPRALVNPEPTAAGDVDGVDTCVARPGELTRRQ